MKTRILALMAPLFVLSLSGCLASTSSPVGLNCDYSLEKPLWEMPLACQGR